MTIKLIIASIGIAGLSVLAGALNHQNPTPNAKTSRVPVLVELFTSEGCNDCPPAEDLVARLQKDQPDSNALIIPLTEHVDYFNSAQWRDRFSSPVFTRRQGSYANLFRLSSSYTPQLVIDGQTECLGSDERAARNAIHIASNRPKATVTLLAKAGAVSIKIGQIPAIPASDRVEVTLAIVEDNLSSDVRGGENEGRHLAHTAVVRSFVHLGAVKPGTPFAASSVLTLQNNWKRADLYAVAFAQDFQNGKVLGAGIVPIEN